MSGRVRGYLFCLCVWGLASAAAAISIEDFEFSTGGSNASLGTINESRGGDDTFGGQTWIRLDTVSGLGRLITVETNSTANPSVTSFGTNAKDVAAVGLRWSGPQDNFDDFDSNGIAPTDFTDAGQSTHLLLDVRFNDAPSTVQVTAYSRTDAASVVSSTATVNLPGGMIDRESVKTFGVPFSAFAGVDFSNVTALEVSATTQEVSPGQRYRGWDLAIDNVRTGAAPAAVPPTSFVPNAHTAALTMPASFISIDQFLDSSTSLLGPGSGGYTGADRLGGMVNHSFPDPTPPIDVLASAFIGHDQVSDDNLLLASHGTHEAQWIATYDGDTDTGLTTFGFVPNPIDLTGGGAFDSIWIGIPHSDVPATMTIEVHSNSGVLNSTAVVDLPTWNYDGTTLVIPFSAFVGAADFTNVTAMRFTTLAEAGGLDLEIDYIIAAAAAGLRGDFDFDGDVDGRDFLIWQRGGSPSPLSASDLADWQAHYGTGSLAASITAVPEPRTVVLFLAGIVATIARRCTLTPKTCVGVRP